MKNKTLVIGDIHGSLKALKQILTEACEKYSNATYIFLGDLVDGWSESAQTIQFLIEFSKMNTCIFIRGNHDEWCYDWLKNKKSNPIWLQHGGKSTVKSYEETINKEAHVLFFEEMKDYYIDSENRLFIHAGFTSMHGPLKETYRSNYSWDRTLWETAVALDSRMSLKSKCYPNRLKLFKEIYIGHTPTTELDSIEPINKANVWNIDTAAAFKGKLTLLDVETKDFIQSDFVYKIYPTENGRN